MIRYMIRYRTIRWFEPQTKPQSRDLLLATTDGRVIEGEYHDGEFIDGEGVEVEIDYWAYWPKHPKENP